MRKQFLWLPVLAVIFATASPLKAVCPVPSQNEVFRKIEGKLSGGGLKNLLNAEARVAITPEAIKVLTDAAQNAIVVEYLVCIAREQHLIADTDVAADCLRRQIFFMSTGPSAEQVMKWQDGNSTCGTAPKPTPRPQPERKQPSSLFPKHIEYDRHGKQLYTQSHSCTQQDQLLAIYRYLNSVGIAYRDYDDPSRLAHAVETLAQPDEPTESHERVVFYKFLVQNGHTQLQWAVRKRPINSNGSYQLTSNQELQKPRLHEPLVNLLKDLGCEKVEKPAVLAAWPADSGWILCGYYEGSPVEGHYEEPGAPPCTIEKTTHAQDEGPSNLPRRLDHIRLNLPRRLYLMNWKNVRQIRMVECPVSEETGAGPHALLDDDRDFTGFSIPAGTSVVVRDAVCPTARSHPKAVWIRVAPVPAGAAQ